MASHLLKVNLHCALQAIVACFAQYYCTAKDLLQLQQPPQLSDLALPRLISGSSNHMVKEYVVSTLIDDSSVQVRLTN